MLKRLSLAAAALGVTTLPAFAHLNPEEHGSFMAGVSHPFFGADHILAMVAVGIWASQIAFSKMTARRCGSCPPPLSAPWPRAS